MTTIDTKNLTPDIMAAARASFIAFYGPQGWADLRDPSVNLFQVLDCDLANLWDGWLARTAVIKAQAVEGPGEVNDWFLSLEEGRQKVLVDDKWALAGAAYRAGMQKHLVTAIADIESVKAVSVVVAPTIEASENEALKMRIALLEELLTNASGYVGNVDHYKADELNERIQAALAGKAEHVPSLFLPAKVECEDGYPSDDQLDAWAVNRCIDRIASMNGHLKSEVVLNSHNPSPNWPILRNPAKVGSVIFQKGVTSQMVIAAAERAYDFSHGDELNLARRVEAGAGACHHDTGGAE